MKKEAEIQRGSEAEKRLKERKTITHFLYISASLPLCFYEVQHV